MMKMTMFAKLLDERIRDAVHTREGACGICHAVAVGDLSCWWAHCGLTKSREVTLAKGEELLAKNVLGCCMAYGTAKAEDCGRAGSQRQAHSSSRLTATSAPSSY